MRALGAAALCGCLGLARAACLVRSGSNCYGNDIGNAGAVDTAQVCCDKCSATAGCVAWSWNRGNDKVCWLKSSCPSPIADSQADSGGLCSVLPGKNCDGNDIADAGEVQSAAECCARCSANAQCAAWTWNSGSDHHCWIKHSCSSPRDDSSADSGSGPGPAPPGPPVPPTPPAPPPHCGLSPGAPPFPEPTASAHVAAPTAEQKFIDDHWPGYLHGVSFGGLFVIEDWMFWRTKEPYSDSTLHLRSGQVYDQLLWSKALAGGSNLSYAYAVADCHLRSYISDSALDDLAAFGINAVRMPVGYWLFDHPSLYSDDPWQHNLTAAAGGEWGVNPDGFVTPGTRPLSDMVMKLHNRNIKVVLDMHALPGCSSPHQSYAGVHCEAQAPNTWNGKAADGISGGYSVTRSKQDSKTWTQYYHKLVYERVVPWMQWMDKRAPGTLIGFETINEPDLQSSDASGAEVRGLTLELGAAVTGCLGSLAKQIKIVVNNGALNYRTSDIARDYMSGFKAYRDNFVTDLHHYYNWGGCQDGGDFQAACACQAGLPGSPYVGQDGDWAAYVNAGVFESGWRVFVGEWSVGLNPAHSCNSGLPTADQAAALWRAQKFDFLSNYVHYRGKAAGNASSWAGDFYWTARMGYNWNPDPSVCSGPTSVTDYKAYSSWDWSFIRLIKLGLAVPLSQWPGGALTPETLGAHKDAACAGSFKVNC
eukprot:TRINITY_DN21176_c0_g2_i1.p1 TRINITY_DN21176_c0_g2~~TRINITY_DN21176_c0_g2_i1.p1  ORF type:complete len:734 (+),score=156.93 TRINITY_DN21176_c0_g2_i1:93-2204(+)